MTNSITTHADNIAIMSANGNKRIEFAAITPTSQEIISVIFNERLHKNFGWSTHFLDITLAELKEVVEWMEGAPHDPKD